LAARELDPQERLDWLRLARTETVGPVTFYALLRRFGSARASLQALPRLSRPVVAMGLRDVEAELTALARLGARLVCWGEPDYPAALATVEDAPPVLTVLGDPALLQMPIVAVVGARNASANGRRIASELSAGLGEAGIVVGSGMARGIDAAAHLGALHSGSVAVVAGGADIVYPEENRGLYDALVERGAGYCRIAARHRASGAPFPAPQPHHLGDGAGRRRRRGGGEIGLADHRAFRLGAGAGSLRGAGLTARSAQPWLQRFAAQWRDPDRDGG